MQDKRAAGVKMTGPGSGERAVGVIESERADRGVWRLRRAHAREGAEMARLCGRACGRKEIRAAVGKMCTYADRERDVGRGE